MTPVSSHSHTSDFGTTAFPVSTTKLKLWMLWLCVAVTVWLCSLIAAGNDHTHARALIRTQTRTRINLNAHRHTHRQVGKRIAFLLVQPDTMAHTCTCFNTRVTQGLLSPPDPTGTVARHPPPLPPPPAYLPLCTYVFQSLRGHVYTTDTHMPYSALPVPSASKKDSLPGIAGSRDFLLTQ